MANHKSALKRVKQTKKKNLRNRMHKSKYRTELKKFFTILEQAKKEQLEKSLPLVHKLIDKARTKHIISKNAAASKKSSLTAAFQKAIKASSTAEANPAVS